jgi:hypothetical protein
MGFLVPTPPKSITERELKGTAFHPSFFSGLKVGDRNLRLNEKELNALKGMMNISMDSERNKKDGRYYKGINEEETEQLIQQVKNNPDFGPKKAEHIEKHLRDFLEHRRA